MKSDGLVKHIFPWDFIVWCPELKLSALAYMELILLLITGFLILKVVRIFSSADKRLALSCGLLQFCYNPFVTMRPYAGSNSNSIFIPELSILSRDVFCFHLMILACVCVYFHGHCWSHVPEIRCALIIWSVHFWFLFWATMDICWCACCFKMLITFLFLDELLIFCYESCMFSFSV
jgi:hypothetical protein